MILFQLAITKVLIRLHRCADWSAPLLFANPEDGPSSIEAHISLCSYLAGLDTLILAQAILYIPTLCASSKGSGETVQMSRLV